MQCAWGATRGELDKCTPVDFILAFICDKCGEKKALDMCQVHVDLWKNRYSTIRCKSCGGTLSWETMNIYTEETECQINHSTL